VSESPQARLAALELRASILEQAAAMLDDERIVGGAMKGSAQDCRMLARWSRDEANDLRKRLREEARARMTAGKK